MRNLSALFLLCLLMVGCGGGEGGGGGGSAAPTPTVTAVTITGPEGPYLVGNNYTFTPNVSLSNGTTQPATGTWGGDAPSVGTISNGIFTPTGTGEVTIFFDASQGGRGSKRLRTHPSYHGSWVGSYRITSCSDSGQMRSLVEFCDDSFFNGRVLPTTMNLTQSGVSVIASVRIGQVQLDQTNGAVENNGELRLDAHRLDDVLSIETTWILQQVQAGRVTGQMTASFRPTNGLSGSARLTAEVFNLNRNSAITVLEGFTPPPPRTVQDALRAIILP